MFCFNYKGVELDICQACQLVWLDEGEEKKILDQKEKHWADGIDPLSPILDSSSGSRSGCGDASVDLGDIIEFVGDALSHLLDGL